MNKLYNSNSQRQNILLFIIPAVLGLSYALLIPATINGDGIGYLRQVLTNQLAPGHLAYLPLLRLLSRFFPNRALLDLGIPLSLLSVAMTTAGLILFSDLARRLLPWPQALFAIVLLGCSHAYSRAATELEVYGSTIFWVIAMLWSLGRSYLSPTKSRALIWVFFSIFFVLGAIFFHLTLGLLLIPLAIALLAHPLFAAKERIILSLGASTLTLVFVALGIIFFASYTEHHNVSSILSWLRGADHGLPYQHSYRTLLAALWGFSKTLIAVPYAYEASKAKIIFLSIATILGWIVLISPRFHSNTSTVTSNSVLDRKFIAAWCVPLTIFGIFFYPSDTDRWLFILPVIILWLANRPPRHGWIVIIIVAVSNIAFALLPAHFDDLAPKLAKQVDRFTNPADLIISPGHGWDELMGLSTITPAQRWVLIYYVGSERSLESAIIKMHQEIDAAFRRGGGVFVARLHDEKDLQGFKELSWFGMSREKFATLFDDYHPASTEIAGLWQLKLHKPSQLLPRH